MQKREALIEPLLRFGRFGSDFELAVADAIEVLRCGEFRKIDRCFLRRSVVMRLSENRGAQQQGSKLWFHA